MNTSRQLCHAGGFNLHKFTCNNKAVLEQIPEEARAKEIQDIDLRFEPLPIERTLGVEWCLESDTFRFVINLNDRPITRRSILSCISSLYDPLGLIAPFLLEGKRLLQITCKEGKDWDDPVSDTVKTQWETWKDDLLKLSSLEVPRCYKAPELGSVTDVQLHHFSDASQDGYGQCSYLRMTDKDYKIVTSLVMAKARVAPLKAIMIPRLELAAAVTSVKISELLNRELTYNDIKNVYWTDSRVVLGYIANESKRFHVYVANRVQQIQDRSSVHDWHHVQMKENPADLASRGASARELLNSRLWWKGPEFLSNHNLTLSVEQPSLSSDDPELRKTTMVHSATTAKLAHADLTVRLEYFSNWYRARRAVANCRRYLARLRDKCFNVGQPAGNGPLSVDELCRAERVILQAIQQKDMLSCCRLLKDSAYVPH